MVYVYLYILLFMESDLRNPSRYPGLYRNCVILVLRASLRGQGKEAARKKQQLLVAPDANAYMPFSPRLRAPGMEMGAKLS